MSFVFPFYNRPVLTFEFCLESLKRQTVQPDEIIVVDYASDKPDTTEMEKVCSDNDIIYIRLPLDDYPRNTKAVYLWNTGANLGIKKATCEYITYAGIDKIYHEKTVESLFRIHEAGEKSGRLSIISGKGININTPPREILKSYNFDELEAAGKWRGGYAFHSAKKEWWHKVRGMDETIKWYGDIDLTRRAMLDGLSATWIREKALHMADHPASHRTYGSPAALEMQQRAKRWINKNREIANNEIVRNDEDWGTLTEKKLKWALDLETQK